MLLIGRAPGGGGARVRSKTLASYWPERRRLRTLGSSEELNPLVFSRKSFPSRLLNVTSRPWGVGGPWKRAPRAFLNASARLSRKLRSLVCGQLKPNTPHCRSANTQRKISPLIVLVFQIQTRPGRGSFWAGSSSCLSHPGVA